MSTFFLFIHSLQHQSQVSNFFLLFQRKQPTWCCVNNPDYRGADSERRCCWILSLSVWINDLLFIEFIEYKVFCSLYVSSEKVEWQWEICHTLRCGLFILLLFVSSLSRMTQTSSVPFTMLICRVCPRTSATWSYSLRQPSPLILSVLRPVYDLCRIQKLMGVKEVQNRFLTHCTPQLFKTSLCS